MSEDRSSPRRRGYAELQATTNFSFLRGASHPWELVVGAEALGLDAIGIHMADLHAGRFGIVGHEAAEGSGPLFRRCGLSEMLGPAGA